MKRNITKKNLNITKKHIILIENDLLTLTYDNTNIFQVQWIFIWVKNSTLPTPQLRYNPDVRILKKLTKC